MTEFWVDLRQLKEQYPRIVCVVEDDGGVPVIASMRCRSPGEGIGTRFIEAMMELADAHQVEIAVEPDTDGGDRLIGWYERHGFYFENSQRLIRLPEMGLRPR